MAVLNMKKTGVVLGAVYIGRGSKWGNPFRLKHESERAAVLEQYRAYLARNPSLVAAARAELTGRDLLCFCAPKACHGDILQAIANGEPF